MEEPRSAARHGVAVPHHRPGQPGDFSMGSLAKLKNNNRPTALTCGVRPATMQKHAFNGRRVRGPTEREKPTPAAPSVLHTCISSLSESVPRKRIPTYGDPIMK